MALPTNPVGLYWENYSTSTNLDDIPQDFNVIFLFQALPAESPSTSGSVTYTRPTNLYANNAALAAEIATCRARGQRIVLTCGGAGAQIKIDTQTRADNFIQSIKNINVQFGGSGTTMAFDGVDFNNFEGAEDAGAPEWMAYASAELKAYYGSDFLITAPPAVHGASPGGQAEHDRLLLATIYDEGALDWFCPQFYDGSGNNTESAINTILDYYNTAITVNGHSVQIPRSKIGIGFAISSNPTWWTVANAAAAYTDAQNDGNEPRGGFNFSANNDPTFSFATTVAPVINPDGGGESSAVKTVNGKAYTSVKTKNGKARASIKTWNGKQF